MTSAFCKGFGSHERSAENGAAGLIMHKDCLAQLIESGLTWHRQLVWKADHVMWWTQQLRSIWQDLAPDGWPLELSRL